MPGSKEEDFLRNIWILHFLHQITSPWGRGGGSWNLQFLVSSPYRWYIPNLVKIVPVVLEKKILTDDGRWMTDDDGRQTIATCHLSSSGDLQMYFDKVCFWSSSTTRLFLIFNLHFLKSDILERELRLQKKTIILYIVFTVNIAYLSFLCYNCFSCRDIFIHNLLDR